jgi:hypothetical protein
MFFKLGYFGGNKTLFIPSMATTFLDFKQIIPINKPERKTRFKITPSQGLGQALRGVRRQIGAAAALW